ncbi:MAG: N-acetylmuramoyl-L-alanine amidase family protein [Acidimicrobiia bacterium]
MRCLTVLLAVLISISACAGETVVSTSTSVVVSTMTVPVSVTTMETTTTTSVPSGPPVAWIAPSGVPMAVTGLDGEVIEVLTPCGDPARLTEGTPIHEVDVVIDPGHGGPIDTGAVAPTGLAEKEINLRVSLEVHEILTSRGIPTMLTRTGDYPVPISTRSEYADLVGAKALVSIHHNAPVAPASGIPGIEIFVQSESSESMRLGGLLYEATMTALGQFDIDWDRAPDAGVMTVLNPEGRDAYGMIRRPESVSVLVELGYIANRAEAELYQDPAYVMTAATGVADAIETFLGTDSAGSGFVKGRVFSPASGVGRDRCIEPDLELSLYPDVIGAEVFAEAEDTFRFEVTMSSPYDSAVRFADAWRVVGDDGGVYGVLELTQDHSAEQPFTAVLSGVAIPDSVRTVTIQGRDQVYGWGGGTVEVTLP